MFDDKLSKNANNKGGPKCKQTFWFEKLHKTGRKQSKNMRKVCDHTLNINLLYHKIHPTKLGTGLSLSYPGYMYIILGDGALGHIMDENDAVTVDSKKFFFCEITEVKTDAKKLG